MVCFCIYLSSVSYKYLQLLKMESTKEKIIKKIEAINNKELLEDLQDFLKALEEIYIEDTFSKEEIASVKG